MDLKPYQKQLLDHITKFKGRGQVLLTGRQMGKSSLANLTRQYKMFEEAKAIKHMMMFTSMVDGKPWYTVRCNQEVASWIRTQAENESWYEHINENWMLHRSEFDISEELYMLMVLTFGK